MRVGGTSYLDDKLVEALKAEVLTSPKFSNELADCQEFVDRSLRLACSPSDRRKVQQEVVYNKRELFVWRITQGEEEWHGFLTEIYANGLSSRDLAALKKIANDHFLFEYENFKEEWFDECEVVFSGVAQVDYNPRTGVAVVIFDDADQARRLRKME
jgi:hypothetical protein